MACMNTAEETKGINRIGARVFVERENHWRARKIKEAVLINAINPTKDVRNGGVMNLEKGYEMDPIWSGFNEVFREMLNKKVRER